MQVTKTVQNDPFCTDTGTKSWTPLVDRVVDDALLQTVPQVNQMLAVSDRQRALYPTLCSQQGWGRDCWEATDSEQWQPEPLAAVMRPSHEPYGPEHCPAEKWSRQKLHRYQAASVSAARPIICSIYFDARIHKYFVFMSKNNCICIYCACQITKLTILSLQDSVATRLRYGGQCNRSFVANLLPNSTVKTIWKSVNICQSYGQKHRGPFFDSQYK